MQKEFGTRRFGLVGATAGLLMAAALVAALVATVPARAADLLVFAAASLKNALDDADAEFAKRGTVVTASYAASGPLAKQMESGAPADVFISADLDWMDYVDKKNLIRKDTRGNLLGNKLVLVAPVASTATIAIAPNFDLAGALGANRLAIGNPQSVPAGKYAQTALTNLGVWDAVKDKTANADSVRSALALVSRGEAPFGIVYQTDTVADKGVKIVATFPAGSHPPIIYPVAITASSSNPAAADYVAFLHSPAAAAFFEKQGFTMLKDAATN